MNTDVCNRLKQIREILELKQKDMADKLAIPQSHYSEIENGKRGLTTNLQLQLIEQLNVNTVWLLSGKGEMFLREEASNSEFGISLTENERQIIQQLREDKTLLKITTGLVKAGKKKDEAVQYLMENLKLTRSEASFLFLIAEENR